jgi:hypothetical protein
MPGRPSAALLCAATLALAAVAEPARAEPQPPARPLPVVVCDSHHHVLRHWLAAAAEGRLPASGVEVVHFDAHPDMGPPPNPIQRAWRAQPDLLVAAVDIESFQLAAAWVGLVRRIVWLRPPWSFQLRDGVRRFRVGTDAKGVLQVDDPDDYYVLEGRWAPTASLQGPVDVELTVLSLPTALPGAPLHEGPVVLDVDLDGFATRNPAADRLRAVGFRDAELLRIRSAFARERLDLPADPVARSAALGELLAALAGVASESVLDQLLGALRLWWMGVPAADLWFLYGLLMDETRGLPVDVLLEEGRTLVGIPERAADPAEIAATAAQLGALVASGAVRPSLVTIARSANDGFTPQAALPEIEWSFLDALRAAHPALDVRYDAGLAPLPRP